MLADAPAAWQVEAIVVRRELVERDTAGARLLKETGPLARVRLVLDCGPVSFSMAAAHGLLDYNGRTQGGAALSTGSRHTEAEAGLRWQPGPKAPWGAASLTLDGLWFRRAIAGTDASLPLTETSTLLLPGLAWRSPEWRIAALPLSAELGWRASVSHRLRVDYGSLYDASSLAAGRRDEWRLALAARLPRAWSLAFEASHARQRPSAPQVLSRGGVAAGVVSQPALGITDVGLRVSREF